MSHSKEEEEREKYVSVIDSLKLLRDAIYMKDFNLAKKRIDYIMRELI